MEEIINIISIICKYYIEICGMLRNIMLSLILYFYYNINCIKKLMLLNFFFIELKI